MKTLDEQMRVILNEFECWWFNVGSGIAPLPGDDQWEHAKRVAERAWINGAMAAMKAAGGL